MENDDKSKKIHLVKNLKFAFHEDKPIMLLEITHMITNN